MLSDLADLLRLHDEEFDDEEKKYTEAIAFLKRNLPESFTPTVDDYIAAAQREVIANILYAAYEGYRANLDNFHSPYTTPFPRMDFTDYIRDHLVGYFPPACEARSICEQFRKALPEHCHEAEDAISSYYITLDVSGPKLAHYVGYMISNKLLPWVVPGYREDYSQTLIYQRELEQYMGYLPM